MIKLTEKDAMDQVFNSKTLTPSERVDKSRYTKGSISQKDIARILLDNGFRIIQEKLYTKQNGKTG